jgi:hypothetical protein
MAGFARARVSSFGGKGLFSPKPPFISSLFREDELKTLPLVAKIQDIAASRRKAPLTCRLNLLNLIIRPRGKGETEGGGSLARETPLSHRVQPADSLGRQPERTRCYRRGEATIADQSNYSVGGGSPAFLKFVFMPFCNN